MTVNEYYDIEGNLIEALAISLKERGLVALEAQRDQFEEGHRVELGLNLQEVTDRESVNPHTLETYHSEFNAALMVNLRSPVEDFAQHRASRGLIRAALARPSGLCVLEENQPYYQMIDIMHSQSINDIVTEEELQAEISTEMVYQIRFRLRPEQMPAP